MRIIEVPREEALRMSTNFLVVEPSKVITASGNEKTKKALEREKVEVVEVGVDELMKGGGSVRCMTMPLMRDEIRR